MTRVRSAWTASPLPTPDNLHTQEARFRVPLRLSKKASQNFPRKRKTKLNRFRPRRTPGWSLLPLRGNSPPVRGRKHISGCKCRICSPTANKLCAQQTAKNCRKSPKGFFDKLRGTLPRASSYCQSRADDPCCAAMPTTVIPGERSGRGNLPAVSAILRKACRVSSVLTMICLSNAQTA